jgi:hypothetical protein
MSTQTFRQLLLTELDRSAELRARMVEDAAFGARRARLRAWQAAQLTHTGTCSTVTLITVWQDAQASHCGGQSEPPTSRS